MPESRSVGLAALTSTQRRIAMLAADGVPVRDVAESLFLTPRGVEQHLAVQCLQVHTANGVVARLAIRLNGTPLVSTDYARSVKTYSWSPADRVAVVTQGHNADMFFDNFAVAHVVV